MKIGVSLTTLYQNLSGVLFDSRCIITTKRVK